MWQNVLKIYFYIAEKKLCRILKENERERERREWKRLFKYILYIFCQIYLHLVKIGCCTWSILRRCMFNVSLPSYKRNSPTLADVTKNQTELSLTKRVINASFLVGRVLSVSSGDAEQRRRSLTDTRINRLVST